MAVPSSKGAALQNPTSHAFIRGGGWVAFEDYEQAELVYGPLGGSCNPPKTAVDGSKHFLRPPNDDDPMPFVWHEAQKAWLRQGGKRLGFTARYLGSHGWLYVCPVP